MTVKFGRSVEDYTEIVFYEDNMQNIIIQVDGEYYETVMGNISYEDLADYLKNYTD
jgi:hypothetical protein